MLIQSRLGVAVCACLCLGAMAAGQQPQKPKFPKQLPPQIRQQLVIDSKGSAGWKRAGASADAILARADRWLATRSSASALSRYVYEGAGYGFTIGNVSIASPRRFRIIFADLKEGDEPITYRATMIADGVRVGWEDRVTELVPRPVTASRLPTRIMDAWPTDFPRIIFAGLGTSDAPFGAFLGAARKAHCAVVAETRKVTIGSQTYVEDRVMVTRQGSQRDGQDFFRTELMFDHKTGAPITLRVTRGTGKTQIRSLLTLLWNLRPGQQFDPALFVLPKVSKPAASTKTAR